MVTLHTNRIGTGPPIVMAHGFTQNRNCWGQLADDLARDHEVVLVDCPGHGESGHDSVDLWQAAQLLVEVGGSATYLGYSMGGRIALHAALLEPKLVSRLVLIGATAGIDDESGRAERRRKDTDLADRLREVGLSVFVDSWLESPLFTGLDGETACRAERLQNRVDGLALSLIHRGTGTQEPLWDRLAELTLPMLVLSGQGDPKFTAVGERIESAAMHAKVDLLTPAGTHAVHLEKPKITAAAIREFVQRTSL